MEGIQVMLLENIHVSAGLVNGSEDFVTQIRYRIDEGDRYITSCLVYFPDCTGKHLPGLPEKPFPVLPIKRPISIVHPFSKRRLNFS